MLDYKHRGDYLKYTSILNLNYNMLDYKLSLDSSNFKF